MDKELPKAFMFGAGSVGRHMLPIVKKDYRVIGYIDNNPKSWGKEVKGLFVHQPEAALQHECEAIVISSHVGLHQISKQLLDMGVDSSKIVTKYLMTQVEARIYFLEHIGAMLDERGVEGCVAEGGVFQGEFAKEINRVFQNRNLYLFDTFEGFDSRDVSKDISRCLSDSVPGHLDNTTVELVLSKLPHPEKCIIKKGYFPESATGLESEDFCFVNLDFDLYDPIYAGLEFFVPRMSKGGFILVHDYYNEQYSGVKKAVADFCANKMQLSLFPIGDGVSCGIGFW